MTDGTDPRLATAGSSPSRDLTSPVFELCAETVQACRAAREGGAQRIELCRDLDQEGLTPGDDLIAAAIPASGLPVHVLLRPRAGDFVYTDAEFAQMQEEMRRALALGAAGFALGLLLPDRRIDIARTRRLVELADGRQVTFHRAFDAAVSLEGALEDVIRTGCGRLLTSGGAADVVTGAATLKRLVAQAGARIEIAVGGGLRIANARQVARATGAMHFHGSLRHAEAVGTPVTDASAQDLASDDQVRSGDVSAIIRELCHGMHHA